MPSRCWKKIFTQRRKDAKIKRFTLLNQAIDGQRLEKSYPLRLRVFASSRDQMPSRGWKKILTQSRKDAKIKTLTPLNQAIDGQRPEKSYPLRLRVFA